MRKTLNAFLYFALAATNGMAFAGTPECSGVAIEQARKLLSFHVGGDDRIEVDPGVKELPLLKNPVNERQKFHVLEVWGNIYKGQYRMRLIYYRNGSTCVLMGQEVLAYANL